MNRDCGKLRQVIRVAGLIGACAFVSGLVVFGTAASSPNPRQDVSTGFPSDASATAPEDRTLVTEAQTELKKDETFTNESKVVAYRFRLESSSEMVHLDISAEVEHGLIRWELIDPFGQVRARIGTTERASMNTSDTQAIKGEWVLRMTLQDATGHYKIHWIR